MQAWRMESHEKPSFRQAFFICSVSSLLLRFDSFTFWICLGRTFSFRLVLG